MKPIIGISLRITNAEKYVEKRDSLSHDWPILLEKITLSPLLIPNTLKDVQTFLDDMGVSGLILSGGDNVGDDPLRDKTEEDIINYAILKNIPLIGICRGMQAINSFFGGKIRTLKNSNHVNKSHKISLKNKMILKENSILVNSFHNNVIESPNLGKDLLPFAFSEEDDTIEGFFHKEFKIFGVMWHPERRPDPNSDELFKKIFLGKELS